MTNLIAAWNLDWNFRDLFRVVILLLAAGLVGTNLAFIIHAPKVFPNGAAVVWRTFFIGKTLITSALALSIWDRLNSDMGIAYYSWLGSAGVLISNVALAMLFRYKMRNSRAPIIKIE